MQALDLNQLKKVPVTIQVLRWLVQKLPRGRMPLLNSLFRHFPPGLFRDKWLGFEMIFNLRDRDSWLLYFHKISERYQTPYFLEFISDGATLFDIGANNGYYSLLATASAKDVKVFAFEANPKLVDQLHHVLDMNSLNKQIKVISGAVSDVEGDVQLDFSDVSHQGKGHIVKQVNGYNNLTTVPALIIDSWMDINHIEHVEIVKIDVEGAEMNVLKGMTRCLETQAVDIILIEVHADTLPAFGTSSTEVFDYLEKYNYQLRILPSELTILPGNRYAPNLTDIPLHELSYTEKPVEGWCHCIAFSERAMRKHQHLLN